MRTLLRRLLVLLAASLIPFSMASAEKFRSAVILPTPDNPRLLASADLNGDGKPDFVSVAYGTNIDITLAVGTESYAPVRSYPLPPGVFFGLTVADVNGDGKKDVVLTGNYGPQGFVAVLLNNGDGSFQTAIVSTVLTNVLLYPVLASPTVGDFDQDGNPDLAMTGPAVVVMKGDGLGHFSTIYVSPDINSGSSLQIADLNLDGYLDLVVVRSPASDIVVYIGDGRGGFVPEFYDSFSDPHVPPAIRSAVVSDIDGDGYPDIIAGTVTSGLQILLNDKTGHFAQAPPGTGASLPSLDRILAVGDFNHDGKLDLAGSSVGLEIFLGKGELTYQSGGLYALQPVAGATVVDDFNEDGLLDVASTTENGIAIAYGNKDGSFRAARSYDLGSPVETSVVSDLNGDGIPDIVAGTDSGPIALLSKGDGTFSIVNSGFPTNGYTPYSMAVADFDGDGKLDVLRTPFGSLPLQLYRGNGDGSFQPPTDYLPFLFGGFIAGDFNNDGKPDVVGGSESFLNTASGIFPASAPSVNGGPGVITADFNKDGKLDIASTAGSSGPGIEVRLGQGDGTFQPAVLYALPNFPFDLAAADLNGDGKLDLVATIGFANEIAILYGNGDGTFGDAILVPTSTVFYSYAQSGFIKGDAKSDLVFSDQILVSVLNGNGNGTFQPPLNYVGGAGKPLIADFNRDGKADVAINNGTAITVLLNCGGAKSTLLASFPKRSQYGQPVTFKIALSAVGGGCGVPTGYVTLTDNGLAFQTGPLTDGQFSATIESLSVGTHVIAGSYAGDTVFDNQDLAPMSYTVVKAHSSTTLRIFRKKEFRRRGVILSATVKPAYSGSPTGLVVFSDGAAVLGQATLSSGMATLILKTHQTPTHSVVAAYLGDTNFRPSSSRSSECRPDHGKIRHHRR